MLDASNLSLQLYTVREAIAKDLDGTLERIAGFGYTQVEPYAFTDFAEGLATGFAKHGLSAPSTHIGLLKEDADQEQIFEAAKGLGIKTVIDPHTDAARWQTEDGIKEIAAGLNAASERAQTHGLTVGYHNHAFELEAKIGDKHGLEVLADNLSPEVVLEVDTYWAYVGGADVPALLERLGERVFALHIKDGDGTKENKNQVGVGDGTIPVWDYIEATTNLQLGVVELDDTSGDVFECIERSFAFLTAGKEK